MKKNNFFSLLIAALLVLFTACQSENQDSKEAAEGNEKDASRMTIFENDFVEVAKFTLKPGEEQDEHEGKLRLVYSLSDYTLDWYEQGESLGEKSWKQGDVHVHTPGKHKGKNTGDTQAEWLIFTYKGGELPEFDVKDLENDVNTIASNYASQIYDDEQFRVTEVKLPANESIPSHDGINRVIYSLSDYTLSYQTGDSEPLEKVFKNGEAHWHEPGKHALKNIGNTEAHYLVISFK